MIIVSLLNVFYYDIIYITPTVKPKELNDSIHYNNLMITIVWSISRQILKGSLINNERAIIIFKDKTK